MPTIGGAPAGAPPLPSKPGGAAPPLPAQLPTDYAPRAGFDTAAKPVLVDVTPRALVVETADIGEGDPYNHEMIERAERRLNGLGYFKKVHISNRPGSSPDRVIVVVEVEDQPTGSISLSGGYSTTQGILAELAYTETNFLGRGQYVRLSVSDGQYSQGWKASFTEPYFLGQRLAAGFDIYHQVQLQNQYALYQNWTTGARSVSASRSRTT